MRVKIIEATQGIESGYNWGKFMVITLDEELMTPSALVAGRVLAMRGWSGREVIVIDLETCEGAAFNPGGLASADLNKHRVWVCILFEPFLQWLYQQDLRDITKLPSIIELPEVPPEMHGYRREGPLADPSLQALLRQMADVPLDDLAPSLRKLRTAWLKAGKPGLKP